VVLRNLTDQVTAGARPAALSHGDAIPDDARLILQHLIQPADGCYLARIVVLCVAVQFQQDTPRAVRAPSSRFTPDRIRSAAPSSMRVAVLTDTPSLLRRRL
jgi:plasmid stability protein